MTALSLDSVTVRLGDVIALRNVSVGLKSGSRMAVVGASGSGKTTLLRAIVGLSGIHSGTISIDDQTVTGPRAFVPAHRRGVGLQPPQVQPQATPASSAITKAQPKRCSPPQPPPTAPCPIQPTSRPGCCGACNAHQAWRGSCSNQRCARWEVFR